MSTDVGSVAPSAAMHGSPPAPSGRRRTVALLTLGVVTVSAWAALQMPRSSTSQEIGPDLTHTITRGDLIVTVTEQGTLESADNTEIKCRVRGENTIIWVVESGSIVKPGDELVRLDTLAIEDAIAERTKYAHLTRSGAERAKADLARAQLAISEYLEGRYRTELMTLQKDLTIAKSNRLTAQNMLAHTEMLSKRGYVSGFDIQERRFAVTRAELNVDVTDTQIGVLKEYTKAMELETLHGDFNAAQARYAAEAERAQMDAARRDLALSELEHCVVKAERGGLVIYPKAEAWKRAPKIEEGATVHQDQTLLLMPDLSQMQVKVGMHESVVERIHPGLAAQITLPGKTLDGEVSAVASVTRAAGWWSGNVVKYDTLITLPSTPGLKPGMTAEVEIVVDRHENVLTIPVTAVVESAEGVFCWIVSAGGAHRRSLALGDSDDNFAVVTSGLQEGDEVVLDALASIEEAQTLALQLVEKATPRSAAEQESDHVD